MVNAQGCGSEKHNRYTKIIDIHESVEATKLADNSMNKKSEAKTKFVVYLYNIIHTPHHSNSVLRFSIKSKVANFLHNS